MEPDRANLSFKHKHDLGAYGLIRSKRGRIDLMQVLTGNSLLEGIILFKL